MNRTPAHRPKSSALPADWHAAEYALQRINAADTFADRVSEELIDAEDEREQVDFIVHGFIHELN